MRKSSWPINLLHARLHIIPERVTACKYSGHVQNCWKRKHNIRGPVWGISPVRHLYWFITRWLSGKLSRQLPFHLMSRWGQGKQGLRIIQDDRPGVCAYLIGEYRVLADADTPVWLFFVPKQCGNVQTQKNSTLASLHASAYLQEYYVFTLQPCNNDNTLQNTKIDYLHKYIHRWHTPPNHMNRQAISSVCISTPPAPSEWFSPGVLNQVFGPGSLFSLHLPP